MDIIKKLFLCVLTAKTILSSAESKNHEYTKFIPDIKNKFSSIWYLMHDMLWNDGDV